MKYLKVIFTLCTILSLSACSSLVANLPSNDKLLQEYTEQDGKECIRDGNIRGFGVLADDVVSVESRLRGEYYLMTTIYRCHSLGFSVQVAFVGNFAEFCSGGGDKIHTGEEACPIKSIFKFESRELAFEAYEAITEKRKALRKDLEAEQEVK